MLNRKQQELYDAFYASTHSGEYLDEKTELLVGLSAAISMNCAPCTRYYLQKAKAAGVKKGEVSEVLAKVMAVAAGQKRVQVGEVLSAYAIDLSDFE
ncbi:MAG: carboxymuconolactone decarboxylase family protein [Thiohalomonadaceae bacterium]